jgi:hypothetical protein
MTLRVCIMNENEAAHPAYAPRYTADDTDQTLLFPECSEPGGESNGGIVKLYQLCLSWRARKGEFPSLRSQLGVTD